MSSRERSAAYSRSTMSLASWNKLVRRRMVEGRCIGTFLLRRGRAPGSPILRFRTASGVSAPPADHHGERVVGALAVLAEDPVGLRLGPQGGVEDRREVRGDAVRGEGHGVAGGEVDVARA